MNARCIKDGKTVKKGDILEVVKAPNWEELIIVKGRTVICEINSPTFKEYFEIVKEVPKLVYSDSMYVDVHKCPECFANEVLKQHKYCPICGRILNWEESK